jgi:predicted RNA-binding Zn-ribbon protein involved in translation (DUF1610 family)
MPERPNDGPLPGGNSQTVKCPNCESGETKLVRTETPALMGDRIYRCVQCGHVDWVELPPGKRT